VVEWPCTSGTTVEDVEEGLVLIGAAEDNDLDVGAVEEWQCLAGAAEEDDDETVTGNCNSCCSLSTAAGSTENK